MKKIHSSMAMILPVLAGLLLMTQVADAECKTEKVSLKIEKYGLKLKPDGGPKCMSVTDPENFTYEFPIELKTTGQVNLRDGQVHVRKVNAKSDNGVPLNCSRTLDFAEPEYTNTGEYDIKVTVVGTGSDYGEMICYEIVVDDIGMIDPRAEVDDQFPTRSQIAGLIEAYDLLIGSRLGDTLSSVSLVEFIEDSYEMTADEAQALINEVRK